MLPKVTRCGFRPLASLLLALAVTSACGPHRLRLLLRVRAEDDINTAIENAGNMCMAILYALQALICLVLLAQLKRRREQRKLRGVFFVLCFLGGLLRCLWFAVPDSVFAQGYRPENRKPANFGSRPFLLNTLQFVLYSLPNCIYSVMYIMLICFWSSLLHLLFGKRGAGTGVGGADGTGMGMGMPSDVGAGSAYGHGSTGFAGAEEGGYGNKAGEGGYSSGHGATTSSILVQSASGFNSGVHGTMSSPLVIPPSFPPAPRSSSHLIAYRPASLFFRYSTLTIVLLQLCLFSLLFLVNFFWVIMATCVFLVLMASFALVAYVSHAVLIVRKLRPVYEHVLRKEEDASKVYPEDEAFMYGACAGEGQGGYYSGSSPDAHEPFGAMGFGSGGRRPKRLLDSDALDNDARDSSLVSVSGGGGGGGSTTSGGTPRGFHFYPTPSTASRMRGRSQLDREVTTSPSVGIGRHNHMVSHMHMQLGDSSASSPLSTSASGGGRFSPHLPPPSHATMMMLHAQSGSSGASSGGGSSFTHGIRAGSSHSSSSLGHRHSFTATGATGATSAAHVQVSTSDELSYEPNEEELESDEEDEEGYTSTEDEEEDADAAAEGQLIGTAALGLTVDPDEEDEEGEDEAEENRSPKGLLYNPNAEEEEEEGQEGADSMTQQVTSAVAAGSSVNSSIVAHAHDSSLNASGHSLGHGPSGVILAPRPLAPLHVHMAAGSPNAQRLFALQQRQHQQQHAAALAAQAQADALYASSSRASSSSLSSFLVSPLRSSPGGSGPLHMPPLKSQGAHIPERCMSATPDHVILEEDCYLPPQGYGHGHGHGSSLDERHSPNGHGVERQPSPHTASTLLATAAGKARGSSSSSGSSGNPSGQASPEPYAQDGSLRMTMGSNGSVAIGAGGRKLKSMSSSNTPTAAGSAQAHYYSAASPLRMVSKPSPFPLSHPSPSSYAPLSSSAAVDLAEEQLALYAYGQTRKVLLLTACVVACSGARIVASIIELHYTWLQMKQDEDDEREGEAEGEGKSGFPAYWWIYIDTYYLLFELLSSSVVTWLLTQSSSDGPSRPGPATYATGVPYTNVYGAQQQHGMGMGMGDAASVPGVAGWGGVNAVGIGRQGYMPLSSGSNAPTPHGRTVPHWHHAHALAAGSALSYGSTGAPPPSAAGTLPSAGLLGVHSPLSSSSAMHARLLGGGLSGVSVIGSSSLGSSVSSAGAGTGTGGGTPAGVLSARGSPRVLLQPHMHAILHHPPMAIPPSQPALSQAAHRENLRQIFGIARSR